MIGNRRSRSVRFIATLLIVMVGGMAVIGYVSVYTEHGSIIATYINGRRTTDARKIMVASQPDVSMGAPQPFHYKREWWSKGRE